MADTKHTPGPYNVVKYGVVKYGNEKWEVQDSARRIAIFDRKADADFFVAAPELLEVLQSAVINIDDWLDENGEFDVTHEGLRTLRQEFEKAIAKVEPPTK